MTGIDKEQINQLKLKEKLLIECVAGTPRYNGIFNSKREMEEKSAKSAIDIGLVRTRVQRLRKGKPDVITEYVYVQEGLEKLGRFKIIKG